MNTSIPQDVGFIKVKSDEILGKPQDEQTYQEYGRMWRLGMVDGKMERVEEITPTPATDADGNEQDWSGFETPRNLVNGNIKINGIEREPFTIDRDKAVAGDAKEYVGLS